MEKEEILLKAQKENKGMDVVDVEAQKTAAWVGYWVLIGLVVFTDILNGVILHYVNRAADFALFSVAFVVFLVKYIRLRKKHELIVTMIYGLLSLSMLAVWILQLVKVI